jgi:hypothetical protein
MTDETEEPTGAEVQFTTYRTEATRGLPFGDIGQP